MIYKLQVYILYNIEIFTRSQSYWGTIIKRKTNTKNEKTIYIEDLVHHVGR